MKKYYVYELYNQMGTIEYVGETVNPNNRFRYHKCIAGNFYKRNDIQMHVVKYFYTKKEAFDYQCKLQSEYGLKTDYDKLKEAGCRISYISNVENTKKGKKYSDETKLKMSLSQIGNKNSVGKRSIETKQRMKDAWAKKKQNSAFLKS